MIEARDFSFFYPETSTPVIDHLNWKVEKGSFALLVGETGCGKSTLLRCCKPELAPAGTRSGSLLIGGRDVEDLPGGVSASLIGFVSQNPKSQVVCDTVWHELAFGLENLGASRDLMRRRIAEVTTVLGLEAIFHKSVNELSGGQLQTVTVASVLAMQPRLLLLDEPTSQLDPVAEKGFCHLLFRVNRELGITVVVVTHAPETMRDYATDVFRLEDGKMLHDDDFLKEGGFSKSDIHGLRDLLSERMGETVPDKPVSESAERANFESSKRTNPESSKAFGAEESKEPHPAEKFTQAPRSETFPSSRPKTSCSADSRALRVKVTQPETARLSRKEASRNSRNLSFKDLWFRYDKDQPWVLRALNLTLEPGKMHALVGGNGSGKTTLLRLLASTVKPTHGRVVNPFEARQVFLPQDPKALFVCDSVLEELQEWQASAGYSDEQIADWLRRFHLTDTENRHPYDLSGGQQQLLAFAKVVLAQPELLLLDEPTKGLDPQSKYLIALACEQLRRQGATLVLSTHDLSFVQALSDTATLIFDGDVACSEEARAFFEGNIFYRPVADTFLRLWDKRLFLADEPGVPLNDASVSADISPDSGAATHSSENAAPTFENSISGSREITQVSWDASPVLDGEPSGGGADDSAGHSEGRAS